MRTSTRSSRRSTVRRSATSSSSALALRWLVTYASGRRGMGMPKAVAAELLDAYNNTGNVIKKRDDTHKMAQANRAFAHYAF